MGQEVLDLTIRFSLDRGQTWTELGGVAQQFSQAFESLSGMMLGSIAALSVGFYAADVPVPPVGCQCAECAACASSQWSQAVAAGVSDEDAYQSLQSLLVRCQPHEVGYVLRQLRLGRVDGGDGRTCFIGLVASCRRTSYMAVGLSNGRSTPFENWLRAIMFGATPANNSRAQLLEQWLVAWLDERVVEGFAWSLGAPPSMRALPRGQQLLAGVWEGGGPGG